MTHYLRPNVQIEPLVNQWHAHPLLIAPQTAALFIARAHLKILKSYIQMPMAHAAALKNPDMIGGPFLDLGGKRVAEVRALKSQTETIAQPLLDLAEAIASLESLLGGADGQPLAERYSQIPEPLRGLIELDYDLQQRASFRFFERLLYRSACDLPAMQSIALALIRSDERPFVFSTPRLAGPGLVQLPLAFDAPELDELVALKSEPRPLGEILEAFPVAPDEREAFASLFHCEPPAPARAFEGDGVRVRYFGHACLLLETRHTSILVDPLISYRYPTRIERFTFEDLPPRIDYALITHVHHDHAVLETLLQLRSRIGTLIVPRSGGGRLQDPSLRLILERLGFAKVLDLDELESHNLADGFLRAVPFLGEHCDLAIRSKSGYFIELLGQSFLVMADSNCLSPELYGRVREELGPVGTLFIGLEAKGAPLSWAYGPLFSHKLERELDQSRRSNGSDARSASELATLFEAQTVCLYAMGLEPWLNYFMALQHGHQDTSRAEIEKLSLDCQRRGIAVKCLYAKDEWRLEPLGPFGPISSGSEHR